MFLLRPSGDTRRLAFSPQRAWHAFTEVRGRVWIASNYGHGKSGSIPACNAMHIAEFAMSTQSGRCRLRGNRALHKVPWCLAGLEELDKIVERAVAMFSVPMVGSEDWPRYRHESRREDGNSETRRKHKGKRGGWLDELPEAVDG
jgi:hypothetical protein